MAGVRKRSPGSANADERITSQSAAAIETRVITGVDPQMNDSISNLRQRAFVPALVDM